MLKYFITDSSSSLVICSQNFEKLLRPIAQGLSKSIIITSRPDEKVDLKNEGESLNEVGQSNSWYGDSDAMLIYTSGEFIIDYINKDIILFPYLSYIYFCTLL